MEAPTRPTRPDTGSAKPRHARPSGHRPGDTAEPALFFLRCAYAADDGRLDRQVTVRELGISTTIGWRRYAFECGQVRELHWHKAAEWAYMLYGTARITAVDPSGQNFVDDVGVGDLWYFPAGTPHSIQGLNPDGCGISPGFS